LLGELGGGLDAGGAAADHGQWCGGIGVGQSSAQPLSVLELRDRVGELGRARHGRCGAAAAHRVDEVVVADGAS